MCPYQENPIFNRIIFGTCMKIKITFLAILLTAGLCAKAQKRDSVTNAELNRYAVMMDSLETLKKNRAQISAKLAKGNTKITPARYTQLLPIVEDQKKLAAAKATPDEISYVKDALKTLTAEGQKFSSTFTSLMSEYVGYDTYNKVKQAVDSDPKVKSRLEVEIYRINGVQYSKE